MLSANRTLRVILGSCASNHVSLAAGLFGRRFDRAQGGFWLVLEYILQWLRARQVEFVAKLNGSRSVCVADCDG